ncbi:hypothetical protein PR048_015170 [Dryococelus australis]|uniref:Uncharacterized protein n=1 Tax=Dryococelus australis TaxID=614101 RepID=A0ABQ9HGF8_9NEOP|nr:hypothetical protein PR048_015170 [Dryococelus australis]
MEQCRNERSGEMGDPRDNPPISGIVRRDSHLRNMERTGRGLNPVHLGGSYTSARVPPLQDCTLRLVE